LRARRSLLGSTLVSTAQVPPGSLLLLLHKGLLYEQLERQVRRPDADGEAKRIKTSWLPPLPALPPVASSAPSAPDSKSLTVLKGHTQSCFLCAWGADDVLASGGGDASARLWKHGEQKAVMSTGEAADVSALAWNAEGSVLATASTDGKVRLWNAEGELTRTLEHHSGTVYALDFADSALLSVGHVRGALWRRRNTKKRADVRTAQDSTAAVWSLESFGLLDVVRDVHSGAILDGKWQPGSLTAVFATCGVDGAALVHFLQKPGAVVTLSGHAGEVNGVAWSSDGKQLATCSADHTARIWAFAGETAAQAHELRGHTREVYTVQWCPVSSSSSPSTNGGESSQPATAAAAATTTATRRVVATASLDASVKLWDADSGAQLHSLTLHSDAVYGLAFDPTGERLCSGGFDGYCHLWNVADASLVKSFKTGGGAGVFSVAWSRKGDKVAAALADGVVVVCEW